MAKIHLLALSIGLLGITAHGQFNSASYDVSGTTYYVSAKAGAGGDGSRERPFGTLEDARDRVREEMLETMTPLEGAVIQLEPGVYFRTESFSLTHEDAFPAYSRLTIQGSAEGESIIHMGRRVPLNKLKPVTDENVIRRLRPEVRDKIRVVDLSSIGVVIEPLPVLYKDYNGGQPEIYFNGSRLPVSKYPNEGTMTMGELVSPGVWWEDQLEGGVFKFKDDRHLAWLDAVESGLWLNGFWRVPWQSWSIRVESIDPVEGTVSHSVPIAEGQKENSGFAGIGSKYTRPNGSLEEPYIAFNLLEEIDLPGEWCIDYSTNKLYVFLEATEGELYISHQTDPIFEIKGASQLTIRNLTFTGAGENGIVIYGGLDNVIEECEFVNLGGWGVIIRGGFRNGVRHSEFTKLGKGGIEISGGDPVNLVPCNNFATHNRLHDLSHLQKTWTGAIKLGVNNMHGGSIGVRQAVGISITDNEIYDLPHIAILTGGNFNEIRRNIIYDIAKETHDVGFIYTRHDMTSRGNVMSDNLFYGVPHANGFYIDDGESGDLVERNVVIQGSTGVSIGGGHYNRVFNNFFIDCKRGVSLDDRGVRRNYTLNNPMKMAELMITERNAKAWYGHFPELCDLYLNKPEWPKGNEITGNHFVRCADNAVYNIKDGDLLEIIQARNTVENNQIVPAEELSIDQTDLIKYFRAYLEKHDRLPDQLPSGY